MTIVGRFERPQDAVDAVRAVIAAGASADQVEVVSAVPIEGLNLPGPKSMIPWLAVAGGCLGLMGGIALPWVTAHSWPMVTGAMPLVPAWTTGVVAYETTMLCAILGTVGGLLVEGRLIGGPDGPVAPPDGASVVVEWEGEDGGAIRDALVSAGGTLS